MPYPRNQDYAVWDDTDVYIAGSCTQPVSGSSRFEMSDVQTFIPDVEFSPAWAYLASKIVDVMNAHPEDPNIKRIWGPLLGGIIIVLAQPLRNFTMHIG